MSDLRKAAEMVVEAHDRGYGKIAHDVAMEALRQALAMENFSEVNQEIEEALKQTEQESVETHYKPRYNPTINAFDTTPPKREWVGLTDEEGAEIWADFYDIDYNRIVTPKEMFKRIEAKLKEKNGG